MQIIGFTFTKISSEKKPNFKYSEVVPSPNIQILDISKTEVKISSIEAVQVKFVYTVSYESKEKSKEEQGNAIFEGNIVLSATSAEIKDLLKDWETKQVSNTFTVPIVNYVIKRTSGLALLLENEIDLPPHIPIPQIPLSAQNKLPSQPQNNKSDKKKK